MKNLSLALGFALVLLSALTGLSAGTELELNEHLTFIKPWLGKWQRTWEVGDQKGTQTVSMQAVANGNGVTIESVITQGSKVVERTYGTAFWNEDRHQIVSLDFAAKGTTVFSKFFPSGNEITIQEDGKNTLLISKSTLLDANTISYEVMVSYEGGKPVPPEQMWKLKFTRSKD